MLVQIYALADHLMLDSLRRTARECVWEWAADNTFVACCERGDKKIHLRSLHRLLIVVYGSTPADDPLRIKITLHGVRTHLKLLKDDEDKYAERVLDYLKGEEPVATGVALKLLSPEHQVDD